MGLPKIFRVGFEGLFFFFIEASHASPVDLVEDPVDLLLLAGMLGIVLVVDGIEVLMGLVEEIVDEQDFGTGNDQVNENEGRQQDDQDLTIMVSKDGGIHDQRQDHAYQCAAQVGVMTDVVLFGPDAVDTEQYEYHGIYPTGYGYGQQKNADAHIRVHGDGSEHDAADRTRHADGTIVAVVSMDEEGKQFAAGATS